MPKPPILIAPAPNEPIASQAWGVPVTDVINGLTNGRGWIGAICSLLAANQTWPVSTAGVALPTPIYDSDGFFVAGQDRFVVPPGLGGIYEVDFHLGSDTAEQGKGLRMAVLRNGTRFAQAQTTAWSASQVTLDIHAIIDCPDGTIINAQFAGNHAGTIKCVVKNMWVRRLGDTPAPIE